MKKIYIICLVFFWHGCLAASDIDALKAQLANIKSFQATFQQQVVTDADKILQRNTGQVLIQKPGYFKWMVDTPYEQLIITEDNTLWMYDVDLEQVSIYDVDKSVGVTPAMLLSGQIDTLEERFNVTKEVLTDGSIGYTLTPKTTGKGINFRQCQLFFDNDMIFAIIIDDDLGQTTQILFSDQKMNHTLPAEVFNMPEFDDLDVVDHRE